MGISHEFVVVRLKVDDLDGTERGRRLKSRTPETGMERERRLSAHLEIRRCLEDRYGEEEEQMRKSKQQSILLCTCCSLLFLPSDPQVTS